MKAGLGTDVDLGGEKKKSSWIAPVLGPRFAGKRWFAIAGGSLVLVAFFVGVLLWPIGILSRPNLSPGADAALLARSEALRLPGKGPAEVADLSNRLITQQDLQALVAKPRLKRLDLHDSSIDDEDLRNLATLKALEWLDLSATLASTEYKPRITDAGLRHLSSLSRLRTLILHGLPVTDAGLEQLKSLSGLERLQLGGTLVTGEGLRHLTNLNWVRLDATPITDEGLRNLQATVGLEELYLDQTKVGDAGLSHLVGLRKLRMLNLHDTEVTPDGVAFLRKHLPALTVGVNQPTGPPQAGFLPVREVAFGRRDLLQECFLNLENGRLFSAPESLVRQLAEQDRWHPGERLQALNVLDWLRTNRVDLMARTGRDGLTLVDGFAILVESGAPGASAFETMEADHALRTSTMLADTLAAYTNQQPQGLSIFWFDPQGAAKTWIFRTRTGRAGALEIIEDGGESSPMKIRYKLVED